MSSNRKTAIVVGAFFLIAMVTSLVGAGLIETVLGAPDMAAALSTGKNQVALGVLMELINGVCVIGIAVLMFPIFKEVNEALGLGYVALRIVEAMLIVAAVIGPLALIGMSQESAQAATFQTAAAPLVAFRAQIAGSLLGIFFGLAALIFYYLLYHSRLVPRWISVWGLIAVVLILAWNLLELFGIQVSAGMVFGLPIILNEILLGIWLIVKGFNSVSIQPEKARLAV